MLTETGLTVFITVIMVVTGACNTLIAKWTDGLKALGQPFEHPFFQANCMFVGEVGCLVVFTIIYMYQKYKDCAPVLVKFNPFLFALPAICDITGTSIQYIGLNLTTASSYQMLRGSVIIFTGLLSMLCLKMQLAGFRWLGMILVTLGLTVVGLCDMLESNTKPNGDEIIFGDILIVGSQILHAVQMVLEQSILQKYDVPPLLAVGLEGTFGMIILSSLLVPMYYIQVPKTFSHNPEHRMEDVFFAFRQIGEQPLIAFGLAAMIVSIAFFNFSAVTTTKRLSATSRMVLDSVRTLIIWMVSIPLFGEKFIPLQILGFLSLILGMFVYNDVFIGPKIRQKILPRLHETPTSVFCAHFWGARVVHDDEELLFNDEEAA
ncbi:unnamed protein product [Bursaphelenchus okinawaensis]|uniref:Solute carrier family 35 member F6 n=1 Tax=Bursaphelenchus okinawaensis TaxID=465554 RepID=A0A811LL83_9BILA|nr:unnamed protein product [Bursaphelenchus okinawaensis]CAG9127728.1 unnamed protein product [Bursaphelenchus okinawaensis]